MKKMVLKEDLIFAINNDRQTAEKCLLAIYNRQTRDEQYTEETKHHNNVGFTGADAHKLTYYAKWVLAGNHLDDRFLNDCIRRLQKYVSQLIKISQGMV